MRQPGGSFAFALSKHPDASSIDAELARHQHWSYASLLRALGVDVVVLPAAERFPDSCFVQDVAVVRRGRALITRPAHPARRREVELIKRPLTRSANQVTASPPNVNLEGGDVLILDDRFVVGLSERTNQQGARLVTSFARANGLPTHIVSVPAGKLHLLSCVSRLPDGSVMGLRDVLEQDGFDGVEKVYVEESEFASCNVATVDDRVVLAKECATTRARIERRGFRTYEVELSEFVKADAGPTCLTLFI